MTTENDVQVTVQIDRLIPTEDAAIAFMKAAFFRLFALGWIEQTMPDNEGDLVMVLTKDMKRVRCVFQFNEFLPISEAERMRGVLAWRYIEHDEARRSTADSAEMDKWNRRYRCGLPPKRRDEEGS